MNPQQENPYAAPSSHVSDHVSQEEGFLCDPPNLVSAGRGISWISEGWALFKDNPGTWIGMIAVYFVISLVLGMLPLVNLLLALVGPVFMGGLMLGAHAAAQGDGVEFSHLFAGFREYFGKLVMVAVIYFVGLIIIMVGVGLFFGLGAGFMSGQSPMASGAGIMTVLTGVLVALLLIVPWAMAIWFAPALIVLNELAPLDAMKLSFRGCLKNFMPFLVFSVVLLILAVLAAIPLFLGFLALVPVMILATYTSYRDIFIDQSAR
ncbi:MAG: BPSS1780 family membrane protein [Sulfuricellaceae bacterium]|nr:BPSS1780 family membrane protein [Sulfuricellaceae bacterium]